MSAHTQHPEIQQNYVRCFCLIFNISHPGNCGSMSFYRNKYSTACRLRKNCSVGKGFLSSLHQQERIYRTVHGCFEFRRRVYLCFFKLLAKI
ncbi:uncharacterized protein [Physcomitrium patens]|uniref:uncharacterized protein isoform X2 n=1 Tax=Physcomitrium patens TaxID=3218 RepID=UPI003CCC995F